MMDEDIAEKIALKAVSLTHVRYSKGDPLGHALSWASLLPVFIGLGGFLSHFIFRRELQAMFFGLGLVVSEFVNQVNELSFSSSLWVFCCTDFVAESRFYENGTLKVTDILSTSSGEWKVRAGCRCHG